LANTGAKALIQALERHGVDVVFGYPGGAILPVYDELRTSSIHHVLTRTEQGAAHAANAFSRTSGRTGVCIVTSGPGATNLVTGLANAYLDSIPLVAITGQVPTKMVGSDAFQEVDITGITHAITKHNYLITDANDIPRIIEEAFYIASTGRPGPVLVDIPKDIAQAPCSAKAPEKVNLPGYKPVYKGHPTQMKVAAALLSEAQRPLIYAGGGIISSKAWDELLELAEKLSAPVVTSLMGKGSFPSQHPLYLGMLGMHGLPGANLAVSQCDVLLAAGARFGDRVTNEVSKFATQAKIIHIDIDPAEIGKNASADIPIVGNVREVLAGIIEKLPDAIAEKKEWSVRIKELKEKNKLMNRMMDIPRLNSRYVIDKLSSLVGDKAIITTDVGQHQMIAAQFYQGAEKGDFLTSGGLGVMGYGLPAAIGAQMAAPERLVFCISGDGSLQMSLNEMATAKEQKLPVKILLFNNNCLGMVLQLEDIYCKGKRFAIDMPGNPDFLKLAEAYGFEALSIDSNDQSESVLKEAINNGRPTLIECKITKEDHVLPMVLGGKGIDDMLLPE